MKMVFLFVCENRRIRFAFHLKAPLPLSILHITSTDSTDDYMRIYFWFPKRRVVFRAENENVFHDHHYHPEHITAISFATLNATA